MKKIFVSIAAIIVALSFTFLSACANKSDVNDNYNNDQVPPADTGEETPENPDDGEGDGEDEESSVKLSEGEWRAAIEASAVADNYTYTIEQSVASSTSQGSASYHTFGTAYIEQNELFFDFDVLDKLYEASDDSAFIYEDMSGYLQYIYVDDVQQNSVCYMQTFNDDGVASEWEHYYTGSESLFYTNILINTLLSIEYRNVDGQRIGTIADIYDYITYNEATDTYSVELDVAGLYDSDGQFIENTAESLRYNMTFAFDGGYLSAFSMSYGDGTTIPKTYMSCTFSDYGSTVVELPSELEALLNGSQQSGKMSEEEWRAAIESSAASENFTADFKITMHDGDYYIEGDADIYYTENLIYVHNEADDNVEQIYYLIEDNGVCEVYFNRTVQSDGVDSGWQKHNVVEGVAAYESFRYLYFFENLPYSVNGQIIGKLSDMYDYMTYDKSANTYSGEFYVSSLSSQISISLTIENGFVGSFYAEVLGSSSVVSCEMELSSYGTTIVTLPEELEAML